MRFSGGILLWIGVSAAVAAQGMYRVFPAKLQDTVSQEPLSMSQKRTPVTLNVQDSTIDYVLNTLTKQAHLELLYNSKNPLFAQRVTVHLTNVAVMDALAVVLRGTGLVAKMATGGETVLVSVKAKHVKVNPVDSTGGVIRGTVTDSATGKGIVGANVAVKNTKLATVTADSGLFTLRNVPQGEQVITIKVFGYRPSIRVVTVQDSIATRMHVLLIPAPNVLTGVVTTAAGVQQKVTVGNSITSLNVDSIMQIAPITSVTDLLETRVPGLTIMHSSGVPGDPSRLRLRGAGSIQGNNDPIIIIDGVRVNSSQSDARNNNLAPSLIGGTSAAGSAGQGGVVTSGQGAYAAPSPLDQIDPNSIETIEVFKGPSASALYGSDAANGVIVITTKHGHAGPTRWSLNVSDGVNWLSGSWPTNYFRFGADLQGNGQVCSWYQPARVCTVDSIVAYQAFNDPQFSLFGHGNDQQASFTVSGGVPTLQYSVTGSVESTLGYLKLPGFVKQQYDSLFGPIPKWMVRPDNLQTWGVTGAFTAAPTPRVRVVFQSSLNNSVQQRSSLEDAITQLEGDYIGGGNVLNPLSTAGNLRPIATTPLVQGYVEKVTDNQLTSTNTVTLTWQVRPWLPLTATIGLNTNQRVDNSYIPYGISASGTSSSACNVAATLLECDTTGSYGVGRGVSHNQTFQVGTTIPVFSHLTVALGGNLYSGTTNDFQDYTNLLAPGVTVPTSFRLRERVDSGFVFLDAPSSQNATSSSTYGVYLQTNLHLFGSMYLNPGFRLDGGSGGSTSSGSVNGLSAFPKIDLSYLAVDRQNERPLAGILSVFRPRVAFGLAGTQPGPADRLRLFTSDFSFFNPGGLTTGGQPASLSNQGSSSCSSLVDPADPVDPVCLVTLGNTQLRPERSSELEGGFDATLWRGRVTVTYSQYNKTRHDAILAIPLATSVSGLDGAPFTIEKNVGEIRNTGTELTLNTILIQTRAIGWNVGANLSNNNSLVVRLNPGQPPICYGNLVGNPCQGTRIVAGYPVFGEWTRPIVAFADANRDGVIESNEIVYGDSAVYVGHPDPKYQVNMTTDLTLFHGRFGVHATFAYQNGLTQNNAGACSSGQFVNLANAPNTPLSTEAAVVASNCSSNAEFGSQNGETEKLSYIGLFQTVNIFRFQDLSINYHVPQRVAMWFRVPRMAVALQGANLGLHTNYRGIDPSVNAFSTVSAGDVTADLGQIPEPRSWRLQFTLGND